MLIAVKFYFIECKIKWIGSEIIKTVRNKERIFTFTHVGILLVSVHKHAAHYDVGWCVCSVCVCAYVMLQPAELELLNGTWT